MWILHTIKHTVDDGRCVPLRTMNAKKKNNQNKKKRKKKKIYSLLICVQHETRLTQIIWLCCLCINVADRPFFFFYFHSVVQFITFLSIRFHSKVAFAIIGFWFRRQCEWWLTTSDVGHFYVLSNSFKISFFFTLKIRFGDDKLKNLIQS